MKRIPSNPGGLDARLRVGVEGLLATLGKLELPF